MPKLICERCSKSFWVIPSRTANARYCSRKCYHPTSLDDSLVADLYEEGQTLAEIAKIFACSKHAVVNSLERQGIERREKTPVCRRRTLFSEYQQEIMDGLLLGDGCVQLYGRTARFKLTTIHEEFSQHIKGLLPVRSSYYRKPAYEGSIKENIVYSKESYPLCSWRDLTFNDIFQRWYPDGTKIVPDDLLLTPTVVKYWFYGDGFSTYCANDRIELGLCTNSFKLTETIRLGKLLNQECGADFFESEALPGQYTLRCGNQRGVRQFFTYIGLCDLECFSYKWKLKTDFLNAGIEARCYLPTGATALPLPFFGTMEKGHTVPIW